MQTQSSGTKHKGENHVLFRELVQDIPSTTFGAFGLFRYPAKFIPQVIAYVIKKYANEADTIFDPFAGFGTAGLVSRIYGHDYELWDLNPMLQYFHDAATTPVPEGFDAEALVSDIRHSDERFVPVWSNITHWHPKSAIPVLAKVWGYYHNVLDDGPTKRLLLIPLLKTTRAFSYNDAARQKLTRSPRSMAKLDAVMEKDWRNIFFNRLEHETQRVVDKLNEYQSLGPKPVHATIRKGVEVVDWDLEEERDILITAPPYLQAQEYIRASKMDLFWLGHSEREVRELGKYEIPYGSVDRVSIESDIYEDWVARLRGEPHILRTFQQYFWGVGGTLKRLQSKIRRYLFVFVG